MAATKIIFRVRDYDLAATLNSGQVFRWQENDNAWTGVVGKNFARLTQTDGGIVAETSTEIDNLNWLRDFLQIGTDLDAVLKTFPDDEPMNRAVASCRGLRLLRQDPWECLASFILSSTKQIVQIRQIVACSANASANLVAASQQNARKSLQDGKCGFLPKAATPTLPVSFPTPQRIAGLTEAELRACKMGFRAPNLLAAARQIAEGKFDLEKIRRLDYAEARAELMKLRGVGGKIADCVLLFAYGFDSAFPVDVWIERALQQLYFPRRRASEPRLRRFAATHFGPHAGYAQQYLFHYMRTKLK